MKKLISKVISCSIVLSASVSLLAAAATPTVFADSESGKIAIYYGAADTSVALAFTTVDEVVDYVKAHNLKV